jgi:hypothetical protein
VVATIYSRAIDPLLNVGLISFSLAAVYAAQILGVSGIVLFARKAAAESREKTK